MRPPTAACGILVTLRPFLLSRRPLPSSRLQSTDSAVARLDRLSAKHEWPHCCLGVSIDVVMVTRYDVVGILKKMEDSFYRTFNERRAEDLEE